MGRGERCQYSERSEIIIEERNMSRISPWMYLCMRTVAGTGSPACSIRQQKSSHVDHSDRDCTRSLLYSAAVAEAVSAYSGSRTVSDESWMEWMWDRYVILTHHIKSA